MSANGLEVHRAYSQTFSIGLSSEDAAVGPGLTERPLTVRINITDFSKIVVKAYNDM